MIRAASGASITNGISKSFWSVRSVRDESGRHHRHLHAGALARQVGAQAVAHADEERLGGAVGATAIGSDGEAGDARHHGDAPRSAAHVGQHGRMQLTVPMMLTSTWGRNSSGENSSGSTGR